MEENKKSHQITQSHFFNREEDRALLCYSPQYNYKARTSYVHALQGDSSNSKYGMVLSRKLDNGANHFLSLFFASQLHFFLSPVHKRDWNIFSFFFRALDR